MPLPTEIHLHRAEKVLELTFDDGKHFRLPAEYLRVESPSAEVQGHSPEQRRLVAGRKDVAIVAIEPIGNYAVRLTFDDMHETGIYSWEYLYLLGQQQEKRWASYLRELGEQGLAR
ncbi:MAG: gamma-butyrobetaine hydroxylase-like domain-containing protein [Acetobacteraceae bacterium]